ncbi:MAG: hypothetical protein H7270_13590 [Dermatophilaceae bacterium]|nr:hypothetical protein [Dermatophilaceae bacterium]
MNAVAVVRPTARRAAVIALGVGFPVIFLALLLTLAATDGSYWSLGGAVLGYMLAWLRASRTCVVAGVDRLTVRNFYGSASVTRGEAQRVAPFSYWANPNFICLAVEVQAKRKPMHATALPGRQSKYEAEAHSIAARLGLPLHDL